MPEDKDLPARPADQLIPFSRQDFISSRQQSALLYSGLLFMLISMFGFSGIVWWLLQAGAILPWSPKNAPSELMWYVGGYLPAFIMFVSAVICAVVGYALLSAAGAAAKEVIPKNDYALLSSLVSDEKEKAIDLYVRLNSLSGATGFFTKIGITGLPLATIALSIFFTLFGLIQGSSTKLFELANLTLGAFLGSYVQRQVSTAQSRPRPVDSEMKPES